MGAANRGILAIDEEEVSNVMPSNMHNELLDPSSEQSASPPPQDLENEIEEIELDDLPPEEKESNECVVMRVRLPNGERLQRRFHYTANMADVTLWTQHECRRHEQAI